MGSNAYIIKIYTYIGEFWIRVGSSNRTCQNVAQSLLSLLLFFYNSVRSLIRRTNSTIKQREIQLRRMCPGQYANGSLSIVPYNSVPILCDWHICSFFLCHVGPFWLWFYNTFCVLDDDVFPYDSTWSLSLWLQNSLNVKEVSAMS